MPNLQGGKKYKSSKHSQETKAVLHEVGEDQQVARVLKVLGNRRMLVYCNDNKQRICKIRGALGKRHWIGIGDIVLISMREELAAGTTGSGALAKFEISGERGDILAKYDQTILGKLKKEDGMNPKLFLTLETMDVANNVKAEDILNNLGEDGEDDIFDDGGDDEPEEGYQTKPKSKDHRNKVVSADDDDIDIANI